MFFIIFLIILVAMFIVGILTYLACDSNVNKHIKNYEKLIEGVNHIDEWNENFDPISGSFDEYMIFLDRLKIPYYKQEIVVPMCLYQRDAGSELTTKRVLLMHNNLNEESYWLAFHKFVFQLRKEKKKELDNKVDEILRKVNLTI